MAMDKMQINGEGKITSLYSSPSLILVDPFRAKDLRRNPTYV